MKTQITKKELEEVGFIDFQVEEIINTLKPIGAELLHRKVRGQKVVGYELKNSNTLPYCGYIAENGERIGHGRELNSLTHKIIGMKALKKLQLISEYTGFPFAINAHGYDATNDSNNGLQAWSCENNEEGHGVEILVFTTKKSIKDFYADYVLFEEVEKADFCEIKDDYEQTDFIQF